MFSQSNSIHEVFQDIDQFSCPYKVNLHCHTIFSDGSLTPIQLYNQATKLNIKHLAITDHHSIQAYQTISNHINTKNINNNITKLWSGVEISCLLNGCLVHILGFGFDVLSEAIQPYLKGESVKGSHLQASHVIKAIKDSGGLSFLAHPARYRLDFKTLIESAYLSGINGIEVWYDYDFLPDWSPTAYICNTILELTNKYKLLSSCGTDSHGYSLLSR